MASNQTANYGLCQWEATDAVLRTDFNEDNAKIDAALKAGADAIAQEVSARVSAVGSEASLRAQALQAEAEARAAADQEEAAIRAQAVAALTTELGKKGNCRIYYTTYVGEGTMDKLPLTFPAKPILVLIQGNNQTCHGIQGSPHLVCANDSSGAQYCAATWSGNSLSWTGNRPGNANVSGITYYVVALMAADE